MENIFDEYDKAEILRNIEILKNFNVEAQNPLKSDTRSKRQATSVDCASLRLLLSQVQANISLTQIKIQNATITLNTLNGQVQNYETKLPTLTGNAADSTTKLMAIYKKLAAATTTSVKSLNDQLTSSKAQEAQILRDIEIYCQITTTTKAPSNPCGKKINQLILFK